MKKVRAHAVSDDTAVHIVFDLAPWLEKASEEEIKRLIQFQWRGFSVDDVVRSIVRFGYPGDPYTRRELRKLLDHVREHGMAFDARANEEEALEWVAKHRPLLLAEHRDPNWRARAVPYMNPSIVEALLTSHHRVLREAAIAALGTTRGEGRSR